MALRCRPRFVWTTPPPAPRKPLAGAASHIYSGAVGLLAGGCTGLVGFGGAQVITPLMTHPLLGLSQIGASGVALSSLGVSTVTGSASFLVAGCAALPVAAAIALPSMVSARLMTRVAERLTGDALKLFFNTFSLILLAGNFYVISTAKPKEKAHACPQAVALARRDSAFAESSDGRKVAEHAAFGVFSGAISALMGVGGLPLTISYLTLNTELPHHLVQGTAICSAVPAILVSAISRISAVPVATAVAVAVGATVGASLGAQGALRLDEVQLRLLYMLALAIFGGSASVRAVGNLRAMLAARWAGKL